MHILIGLGAAVALLYFWLLGHWFARILVFLCLLVFAGFAGVIIAAIARDASGYAVALIVFGTCVGFAWPGASLPIWYWQKRLGIA